MPLMHGKSEKAFQHNVRAEMEAGKPQKQSLAIAYAMKKRAHKAMGGESCPGEECPGCKMCKGGMMAEGGMVHEAEETDKNSKADQGMSKAGEHARYGELHKARDKHREVLAHLEGQKHKDRKYLAEGGMVDGEKEDEGMEDFDMISRIMKSRAMSKGGMVANDTPILADFKENDFDDLALRDDLEADYTGENSGDEIGNEKMDEDDHDIVARVMRSRAKKDRMPRPA